MKIIIAGSRAAKYDPERWQKAIVRAIGESLFRIDEVVCGCADGVDAFGEQWAREQRIPVKQFPADWVRNGKRAGILRNCEMAQYADALIAVWDGQSPGTRHMINQMAKLKKKVYIKIVQATPGLSSGDGTSPTKKISRVRSSTPGPWSRTTGGSGPAL